MNHYELQFYLTPSPGKKPEFLATVRPMDTKTTTNQSDEGLIIWKQICDNLQKNTNATNNTNNNNNDNNHTNTLPMTIVLEDYTREGWAWKPNVKHFTSVRILSVDGRNKFIGFIDYLKQRQKSVYGRIQNTQFLIVISYIQPNHHNKLNPNEIECRISTDMTSIPNCTLTPLSTKNPIKQQQQQNNNAKPTAWFH